MALLRRESFRRRRATRRKRRASAAADTAAMGMKGGSEWCRWWRGGGVGSGWRDGMLKERSKNARKVISG